MIVIELNSVDFSDLSRLNNVLKSESNLISRIDCCVLNAGSIGNVTQAKRVSSSDILKTFRINCLSNKLIIDALLDYSPCSKFIFISSGASSKGYSGWLEYCSTKSFTDSMLRVYARENRDRIFISVSPGAMDTSMQSLIRAVSCDELPDMNKFHDLYASSSLRDPSDAASNLLEYIENLSQESSGQFFVV